MKTLREIEESARDALIDNLSQTFVFENHESAMDFLGQIETPSNNEENVVGVVLNTKSVITVTEHSNPTLLESIAKEFGGKRHKTENINQSFFEASAAPHQNSPHYRKLSPGLKKAVDETMVVWSKSGKVEGLEKAAQQSAQKHGVNKKDILDFFEKVILGEAVDDKDNKEPTVADRTKEKIAQEKERDEKRFQDLITKAKIQDLKDKQVEKEKEDEKKRQQAEGLISQLATNSGANVAYHAEGGFTIINTIERAAILDIYNQLNEENRNNMQKRLEQSKESCRKTIEFCTSHAFSD